MRAFSVVMSFCSALLIVALGYVVLSSIFRGPSPAPPDPHGIITIAADETVIGVSSGRLHTLSPGNYVIYVDGAPDAGASIRLRSGDLMPLRALENARFTDCAPVYQ